MRNKNKKPSLETLSERLRARSSSINHMPRPEFIAELFARLHAARTSVALSSGLPSRLVAWFRSHLVVALTPVVAFAVIAMLVFQPFFGTKKVYAQELFTLTPQSNDSLGMSADAPLILKSTENINSGDIKNALRLAVKDDLVFAVKQLSARKVEIAISSDVAPKDIIRASLSAAEVFPNAQNVLRDYHWAFQIKDTFRVKSTIPGNHTTDVPVDAGIEFQFSHENIDAKAFERALSINPTVKGHIEHSRNMFVFTPDEKLKEATVYTVTLRGDLGPEGSDDTLGADYTFLFETELRANDNNSFANLFLDHYVNVSPNAPLFLPADRYSNSGNGEEKLHVVSYRLPDWQSYLDIIQATTDNSIWRAYQNPTDLTGGQTYPTAYQFDATFQELNRQSFIVFPEAFASGHYLVDITYTQGDASARNWILVSSTSLTAYASRAINQTLVWANSADTGKPINAARVGYDGSDPSATTSAQGLATIPAAADQSRIVIVSKDNESLAVVLPEPWRPFDGDDNTWEVNKSNNYWRYIYTDRPLYHPTDSAHVWGYVSGREGVATPKSVRIEMQNVGFVDTEVSENGIYTADFSFRNIPYGSNSITVNTKDQNGAWTTIDSRSVDIFEFEKPAYTLSLSTQEGAVFAPTDIHYTLTGAFFEGTPVKGLEVDVALGNGCDLQTVTLDATGSASGVLHLSEKDTCLNPNERFPQNVVLEARPARGEKADISARASVHVFLPKVYIDVNYGDAQIVDGQGRVTVTLHNVEAKDSYDPLVFAPTVASGQEVKGEVHEIYYTKRSTGTYYDFINKRTVETFDYDRHDDIVTQLIGTTDRLGQVMWTFDASHKNSSYFVNISATDAQGKTDHDTVYVGSRETYPRPEDSMWLSFNNKDAPPVEPWTFPGYNIGDTMHLGVNQGDVPLKSESGDVFLIYKAQQGIMDAQISANPNINETFKAEDVPNIWFYGVLLRGGKYININPMFVNFNKDLRKIEISIESDKAEYRPGQKAHLTITTKDASGQPVSAALNINVVDEAFYELRPESVDPLQGVYSGLEPGIIVTASSTDLASTTSGAEKGGGGERASSRTLFKDTTAFISTATNRQGRAEVDFEFPDNITSWRLTTQAIADDGKFSGHKVENINVSMPFFVSPVIKDSYLQNDKAMIAMYASGKNINPDDSVEYTVSIPDANITTTLIARAGETARTPLPTLALGDHVVTITGKSGNFTDSVMHTLRIVPSRLTVPVLTSITSAGAIAEIPGSADAYSTVTFTDAGRAKVYNDLMVMQGTVSGRTDEKIVHDVATLLLQQYFGQSGTFEPSISVYQNQGLGVVDYADPSIDFSAKAALLGTHNSPINESLAMYFSAQLSQDEVKLTNLETVQSLVALASLGDVHLTDLQNMRAIYEDDVYESTWIALGLFAAGDQENARDIYKRLVDQTTVDGIYRYIDANKAEKTMEQTALLAALASALDMPEYEAFENYIRTQPAGDTSVLLERGLALQQRLPHLNQSNARLTYNLHGEKQSFAFSTEQPSLTLMLSPDDRASLSAQVVSGEVSVVTSYQTPLVNVSPSTLSGITLSKTYTNDNGSKDIHEGDVIHVTVRYHIPEKCGQSSATVRKGQEDAVSDSPTLLCQGYEITDTLPSGLASMDNVFSGVITHNAFSHNRPLEFSYKTRAVTAGTYVIEPLYLRSLEDPNQNYHTDAQTLTILP